MEGTSKDVNWLREDFAHYQIKLAHLFYGHHELILKKGLAVKPEPGLISVITHDAMGKSVDFSVAFPHIEFVHFEIVNMNGFTRPAFYMRLSKVAARRIRENLFIPTEDDYGRHDPYRYIQHTLIVLFSRYMVCFIDHLQDEFFLCGGSEWKSWADLTSVFQNQVASRRAEMIIQNNTRRGTSISTREPFVDVTEERVANGDEARNDVTSLLEYLGIRIEHDKVVSDRRGLLKPATSSKAAMKAHHHRSTNSGWDGKTQAFSGRERFIEPPAQFENSMTVKEFFQTHVLTANSPRVAIINGRTHSTASSVPAMMMTRARENPGLPTKRAKIAKAKEVFTLDDDEEVDQPATSAAENGSVTPAAVDGGTDLLRFPESGNDYVVVKLDDLKGLCHGELLNDNIIEFYLKFIWRQIVPASRRDKIHIFSNFFYTKMIGVLDKDKFFGRTVRAAEMRFNAIQRAFSTGRGFTRHIDVFEKDYLVFPVNDELHWYIVVVVHPRLALCDVKRETTSEDRRLNAPPPVGEKPRSWIVVFDSLKDPTDPKRRLIAEMLKDFLEVEWNLKRGKNEQKTFVRTLMQRVDPKNLPQQTNFVDCGFYLLKFMEVFLEKPPYERDQDARFDFKREYPGFTIRMRVQRDIVRTALKKVASPERWRKLELYEQNIGRSKLGEDALVELARRPRRFSETEQRDQARGIRKRFPSEPPDPHNAPPSTAPSKTVEH